MAESALMYVRPFLVAFGVTAALCGVVVLAHRYRHVRDRRTGARHRHDASVSRFGGVAMIVAFCVTLVADPYLVFDYTIWVLVVGSGVILLFGVIDDVRPLSWRTQLFVQVALVLLTFIFGVRITAIADPFGGTIPLVVGSVAVGSLVFMLVWMIVVMNALNWADGIDGLAGGTVVIAALAIFVVTLRPEVVQPPLAIITMTLAGTVMGFLLFNIPPARIFAGTSGAFFMGYIIAVTAIMAGAKVGTTLMVLAVPLVDAAWVVVCRLCRNVSIFHCDTGHVHHRLLRRGWSVRRVLLLYYGVTLCCAVAALTIMSSYKWVAFAVIAVAIVLFFFSYTRDRCGYALCE